MNKDVQNVVIIFTLVFLVSLGGSQLYKQEQLYASRIEAGLAQELAVVDADFISIKEERLKAEQLRILNLQQAAQAAEVLKQQADEELAKASAAEDEEEERALAASRSEAESAAIRAAAAEASRVAAAKKAAAEAARLRAEQLAIEQAAAELAQQQADELAAAKAAAKKSSRSSRAS